MDVRLSRAGIPDKGTDPHDWNSWDRYQVIHEKRVASHEFIDHCNPDNTLGFTEYSGFIHQAGRVSCLGGVVLEVEKILSLTRIGGVLKVRGDKYLYSAWIPRSAGQRKSPVLRYHNIHERDDYYHHRAFNPQTGNQVLYEKLQRFQFPTLDEVLDEIRRILELYPPVAD